MASSGFRYTPDIRTATEPWREKLGRDYESVVARLVDRDRALEDYVTGTGRPSPTAASLGDRVAFLLSPPECRVFNSGAQGTLSGTPLVLAYDSERYDPWLMHDTVTNPSRITFGVAGVYDLKGMIEWQLNAAGTREFAIRINGATYIAINEAPAANEAQGQTVATDYLMAAGDYAELIVKQTSGGGLNVNASGNFSGEFSARWAGLGT
jgi:hypothetical protein